MPKSNLIDVEGEVEILLNSVSQERKDGVTDYVFKATDVVFIPKTEYRVCSFSSNEVTDYLTVLGAKTTRDVRKANVILGHAFEKYRVRHYTWGDNGPFVDWNNFEQKVNRNHSYVKNGVTKTDAKVLGSTIINVRGTTHLYPDWGLCVRKGILSPRYSVNEYTLAINTHLINNPSIVLISDMRSFLHQMNKHNNAGKRTFNSDDKYRLEQISRYTDESTLEIMRMGYDRVDLSNDLDFFVELFYSKPTTTEMRGMLRGLFKRNEGMTDLLSVRRNYTKSVDENGALCEVARRAKVRDIPVNFNNIINSWL